MKKFLTLFTALLFFGSLTVVQATTYYYRGNQNSWGTTEMTTSTDGYYAYYSAKGYSNNGNKNNEFKISTTTDSWDYNSSYVTRGFNGTDIKNTSDNKSIGLDWNGDNICVYCTSDFYVLVYFPNTTINTTSNPIICASTTLPDNSVPVSHTYTVAGEPTTIIGAYWNPAEAANDMVEDNGIYTWEKTDLELEAGHVYFKVCEDHDWSNASWPSDNYDLTIPADGIYTITITFNPAAEGDAKVSANATKTGEITPVQHTYTVAGAPAAVIGAYWASDYADNDMVLQSNGTYKWEKEGAELAKDAVVSFKVCQDHAWTVAYPADDYNINIPADGIYTITITFNPEGSVVSGEATKTGDAVVAQTAQMKGSWDSWTDNVDYVDNGDGTATVAKRFEATGDYTFKVIINDNWRGEENTTFTRTENTVADIINNAADMTLHVDVPGCYTFTWNFDENKLAIQYPSQTIDVAAIVNNQTGTLVESAEQIQGTELHFGVAPDGSRVVANAANAILFVDGHYNNEHGMVTPTFSVLVPGNVDIYVGKCTYSTKTINVRNAANEIVASKTPTAACWKNDHANSTVLHYVGEATKLTISGMDYCPYIRVKSVEPVALPEYINVHAQVNNQTGTNLTNDEMAAQGNAVSFGMNAANERVAADAANAILTVNGNYHSDHGMTNAVFTVHVPGNVDIYVGECTYSSKTINVKDEDNNLVASLTPEAVCWKNNHDNLAVLHYVGEANTLTISGMDYCPYICVKSTPVAVPSEIDIPAIVNNQAGTLLEGGELVQNTPVNFGVTAEGNRVAADNPNAILYVNGAYHSEHGLKNPTFTVRVPGEVEIYVGECTYSTATIEVRNAENALMDSKTPETVCWKNNPDNVAVLHYAGEATTLTISGMQYCPYIRVKTPTPPVVATIGDANNASEIQLFLTTNDGQTVDELTINRPVLNNMYNTLCLPFDMDAAQIAASSLNGIEIREFTGASVVGGELNISVSEPVNAVVAGRPYFVKFSAAAQLDNLNFEDVEINNADLDNEAVSFNGVTFKGTFTPYYMEQQSDVDYYGGYMFLGQNNTLYWPGVNGYLKPFRAYFYINLSGASSMPLHRGMPARIVESHSAATDIDQINDQQITNKIIRDGQLIIIRDGVFYNAMGTKIQ